MGNQQLCPEKGRVQRLSKANNKYNSYCENKVNIHEASRVGEARSAWVNDSNYLQDIVQTLKITRKGGYDAVKIKYEAKAILMVYNEVHYKGEDAGVYFYKANNTMKQPVFEVQFAKNKIHSFKGRSFFEFFPDMARLEESDERSSKIYANTIFSS